MLNKGIGGIFNVASNYLFNILDIQDSGQIPAFVSQEIAKGSNAKGFINKEIVDVFNQLKKFYPDSIGVLDAKKVATSEQKRILAHKAMNDQYRQWWGNPNANANAGTAQPVEDKTPKAKIDNILIDDFAKRKWI